MRGGAQRILAALAVAIAAAASPAHGMTCTKDLSPAEFAGERPYEMTCGTVAVSLLPIQSEMYYHRWSGEVTVRSIRGDDEARINLAAFDASGGLVGVMAVVPRDIGVKTKTISFRMDGMYLSTVNAAKVLLSVSVPDRKAR
jgi:hypothetical protein